jgi:hypothetical protein
VLVILGEARLVGVGMGVGLPVVAVFMLVFHVLVLMQDVGMRMRYVPVGVLMGVLFSHLPCSISLFVLTFQCYMLCVDRFNHSFVYV